VRVFFLEQIWCNDAPEPLVDTVYTQNTLNAASTFPHDSLTPLLSLGILFNSDWLFISWTCAKLIVAGSTYMKVILWQWNYALNGGKLLCSSRAVACRWAM